MDGNSDFSGNGTGVIEPIYCYDNIPSGKHPNKNSNKDFKNDII